ncbi:alanine racemase [Litoribrevibacter albus]|uniref:Alanine racemase N-terminal domain-containing protein n=1 Tax=Litoribrevibacter albus TaxID=1473156 RepID=A0AA37SCU6_9GAMM|nr:alanine racemase [Litoribrevibacter albus]GLQ33084.1 hypothetical protein GCM10007876_35630 [Litoribrevibacter albus]
MHQPERSQDTPYFHQLNRLLTQHGEGTPHLIVDLDRLDANLATLCHSVSRDTALRLVAKSLPCIGLLSYLSERLGSQSFMTFHLPFLMQLIEHFPDSNLLLGKPLPARAVQRAYERMHQHTNAFSPEEQLHWLVDTPARLNQYLTIAQKFGTRIAVTIEIDIGLHRGGVTDQTTLDVMLTTIRNHPKFLRFTGFMGYDAHVGKLPRVVESTQASYQRSQHQYQTYINYTRSYFPELWADNLILNGAGSPTIELHKNSSVCNDLSVGSALVKPSHFDLPLLTDYQPASFIASPIIKQWSGMNLPGPEWISRLLQRLHPKHQQTFFIYGGLWRADLIDARLRHNSLYGESANQAILNGTSQLTLAPDDHIFWRPQESEAVFLQFGDVLAVRNGVLEARWPVLKH